MDDPATPLTTLVVAAEQGDAGAWQALVRRYSPLVASVIRGFRLQGHDADDVAQTVWLRLVEHLGELREKQALPKWIMSVTRNECLRLVKTSKRTRPIDPTDENAGLDRATTAQPDDDLLKAEGHQALLLAFAELPEHQRELLLLLIADPPVPYAEISERLDIPVGSIGPTRARALRRLREQSLIAEWQQPDRRSDSKGGGGYDFASL